MSDLTELASALPEWATAIASQLDKKQLKKVNRTLAMEMRAVNRDRIRAQTDPDGSRFVDPLKASNNPMFRELTKARHLKFNATSRYAQIGFKGSAAKIARIHHEGQRSTVRPDSSKKFPYPERPLIGVSDADRHIIIRVLRESLTSD
ncbi:phage virion morphogenesis protein [Psychrobacter celer]|uniref:phage virion morphogenesis protein n=1 Tax=Psychrobacter celer TaxID=306572 RepID=UPI003FD12C01